MASFDDIPLEVQEQIFLHLTPKDLKACSFVCLKWHDIINSNQIWLKMCALEGLVGKKFLDDTFSLIQNPLKQFPSETSLGPLCHWRSHFNRYKYIKRNWRIGYFSRVPVRFTPIYISEKYIVQLKDNIRKDNWSVGWSNQSCQLVIWEVCGSLQQFCSINLIRPESKVDKFLWKGEFIVYVQQRHVICLKRSEKSFRETLQIKLESGNCSQSQQSNCMKSQLTVKLSEKFLLIQDHLNPCSLTFYDCNKGILIRKVDLHRALGNQSLYCSCLEVIDEKVFLAYKMSSNSFVAKYDFGRDTWESPISLPNEAVELYLSRRFVCVKLSPESRDTPISILQVWDHLASPQPTEEVSEFYTSKHLRIVLTDDLIIFHSRDEIKIHGLLNDVVKVFPVSRGVMKFRPIWNKYLVILDERGVSVWDRETGKKINTPFRDDMCSTFYVSETNIIVRRDDEQFFIISYW